MEQLKLTNSNFVVMLDSIDAAWAKDFQWELDIQNGVSIIISRSPVTGKTISLVREIASKVLGSDFVDKHARPKLKTKNGFDLRRFNIVVVKSYNLIERTSI